MISVCGSDGELEKLNKAAEEANLDVTIKTERNDEIAMFCVSLKNTFEELFDFDSLLEYYAELVTAAKLTKSKERALEVLKEKLMGLEDRKIDDYVKQLCFRDNYGIGTRKITIAGITPHPNERWMKQIARNVTMADWGCLSDCRHFIHDRDSKFCKSFRSIIASMGIKPIRLPPQSPKMNSFAERFVRSIKEECLNKLIFFGEESLRKAIGEYIEHYHEERNHQGKDNFLLFPDTKLVSNQGKIQCCKRLKLSDLYA